MKMNENKPILFESEDECCGCAACQAICPVGAIRMIMDDDGFYYPVVDEKICICCRKCLQVCVFKM